MVLSEVVVLVWVEDCTVVWEVLEDVNVDVAVDADVEVWVVVEVLVADEEVDVTVVEVEVRLGLEVLVVVSVGPPASGMTVRSPEPFPGSSTAYTAPVNLS